MQDRVPASPSVGPPLHRKKLSSSDEPACRKGFSSVKISVVIVAVNYLSRPNRIAVRLSFVALELSQTAIHSPGLSSISVG